MQHINGALAARAFICFACAYLLSYTFRSVNAVIAPALREDAGLSNSDLGLLSSAYFITFAALQLPLGIWLDKYGPRRIEAALLLFAAAGAAIFACSNSLAGLWIGRAMIGIGVSACLMAPFKAFRLWYPLERQSQLASWMLMAGSSGALIATVPVASILPLIGWRGVFWTMSGMVMLVAAAIFFLLKDAEAMHAAKPAPAAQPVPDNQGYRDIFRNPYFRRMAVLGMINQGSFSALQTLWAGPWMTTVLGMDKQQTANVLFIFNLCLMLSYLSLSWWAPRFLSQDGSRGWPTTRAIAVGLSGSLLTQIVMIASAAPWTWALWIVLAFCATVGTLVQTSVGLSFPTALAGRANSAYNLSIFIGAFIMQWGIGLLIDAFRGYTSSPADAMRAAFAVCAAAQAVALLSFTLNRSRPQKV